MEPREEFQADWYADVAAVLALLALTVVVAWDFLLGDITAGHDAVSQFYPWYSFLGESLWNGDIPAWNPHQFSGTPFVADPLSGWTYLPAMLLFTLLPFVAAAKSYMLLHLLLAGLSTYALARVLGIGTPGALLAATAYEYGSFLYVHDICCPAYPAVMAWLPLALLGAEMAIRGVRPLQRAPWWGLSGLALSQILAAWLGQGSYYALLALGGYIAYRTLLVPPENVRGVRSRITGLALHGGAVLAIGFGLAAAGVLPRLEFNALSNLAGGYPDAERAGGWSLSDWGLLLEPGYYFYAGVSVLALALSAPVISRGRFAVPYFAALFLGALVLTGQESTPLHSALYLLPRFEQLHPHDPDRILVIFYLAAALLAGATLTSVRTLSGKKLVLPVLIAPLLVITSALAPPTQVETERWNVLSNVGLIPSGLLLALIPAVVLVPAYALIPARTPRALVLASIILVVFADLLASGRSATTEHPDGAGVKMDLAAYYRPSEAEQFLRSQEEPFRYFGYGTYAPRWFDEPVTHTLKANNRAMVLGLQNVQGYNAVYLARYGEYIRALNGEEQQYHYTDVYEAGPLLDLLNARYVLVPTDTPPEEEADEQPAFLEEYTTVYEDDRSRVLENPKALPRAWIVHSARQANSKEEALDLLSSGQVDPEETALLEEEPPRISQPDDPSADRASLTEYDADQIRLKTSTGAPGLLVLSEVYYPAWKAYVDGSPAPVYATDYLLRSVPVPAGEHEVELRYESWTLQVGMAISLGTYTVLAAVATIAVVRRWRERNRLQRQNLTADC